MTTVKLPSTAPLRLSRDLVQHYLLSLRRDSVHNWPLPEPLQGPGPVQSVFDLAHYYYRKAVILGRDELRTIWANKGARFQAAVQREWLKRQQLGTLQVLLPPSEPAAQWLLEQLHNKHKLPRLPQQVPAGIQRLVVWVVAPDLVAASHTVRTLWLRIAPHVHVTTPLKHVTVVVLALTATSQVQQQDAAVRAITVLQTQSPSSSLLRVLPADRIRAFHASLQGRPQVTWAESFCAAFTRDALTTETTTMTAWLAAPESAGSAIHMRPMFQPPRWREGQADWWPLVLVKGNLETAYQWGLVLYPLPEAAAAADAVADTSRTEESSPPLAPPPLSPQAEEEEDPLLDPFDYFDYDPSPFPDFDFSVSLRK